jgi:hypothetical protein
MDKNPKTLLSALDIAKISILSPKDVCLLINISKIVSQVDDAHLRQLLGLLNNLRETTPFGETHKRETTPSGETHGMEWGESVKDKADITNNYIQDDTIELMVDDSTIQFVNRSESQEDEINIPLDKLYITNPITGRKRLLLNPEDKALRNKRFREKMRAKVRKEREECKKLGIPFKKRRISKGKKQRQRGTHRPKKACPKGPSSVL